MASLFSPTPFKSTKSQIPRSGLEAISKATTLQDENPFDSISGPLRKRKRRKVAEELHEQGIEIGSPEYFKQFRDKLIEFGDTEGAQTVEAARVENEQRLIKNKQTDSLIGSRANQNENRSANTTIKAGDVASKISKREADINVDLEKLKDTDARIKILQQNAGTQSERVRLEGIRTAIAQRAEGLNNELKSARIDNMKARTKGMTLENTILETTGSLPSRASLSKSAAEAGAKVADAQRLITSLKDNLANAKNSRFLPGDDVSGIEGWTKGKFGGLIRQLTGGLIDVGTGSITQKQSYEYLGSLLVPILLNEKKVTDQDRERVERIVGNLKAASDNKEATKILTNLEGFIGGLPDLAPGKTDKDEDTSNNISDSALQSLPRITSQEEYDALEPGDLFIDPEDGLPYEKVIDPEDGLLYEKE